MAKARGKVATIGISAAGVTYTDFGNRVDGSYSIDTDTIDATDCDSADKESIYGDSQVKLDFSCRYDPSDTAQAALLTAKFAKSDQYFRVRPQVGTGLPQISFLGRITSASVDVGMGAVQELKVTVESSGTITNGTQS